MLRSMQKGLMITPLQGFDHNVHFDGLYPSLLYHALSGLNAKLILTRTFREGRILDLPIACA